VRPRTDLDAEISCIFQESNLQLSVLELVTVLSYVCFYTRTHAHARARARTHTHTHTTTVYIHALPLLGSRFRPPTADVPHPLGSRTVPMPQVQQLKQPHCFLHTLQLTTAYAIPAQGSRLKTDQLTYCHCRFSTNSNVIIVSDITTDGQSASLSWCQALL
jgi:hypothetical protein